MFIISASPDININAFLSLVHESDCNFTIDTFYNWHNNNCLIIPQGFIYIRVTPEISLKRSNFSLQELYKIYAIQNDYFVEKTSMPKNLCSIPILILNGNINFETDFSQFYNHLFYIKKLLNQIQEQKNIALGIYKEKSPHRYCC